jgi:hypothetical protein
VLQGLFDRCRMSNNQTYRDRHRLIDKEKIRDNSPDYCSDKKKNNTRRCQTAKRKQDIIEHLTLESLVFVVIILIMQVGIELRIKYDIIYPGVIFLFCGFCMLISHPFIPIAGAVYNISIL